MSHPVFLNSVPTAHMPDGSRGEWRAFWELEGPELEAIARLPLLWLALFRPSHLQWARLVDEEDVDSEGYADLLDDRIETRQSFEATYPYLIAPIAEALATLASRKDVLVRGIGLQYAPVIDEFERFVRERYGPFVVLRTSGLPDVEDFGPALAGVLSDFDALTSGQTAAEGNTITAEIAEFARFHQRDPVGLLSGTASGADWPPPVLMQQAPVANRQSKMVHVRQRWVQALLDWVPGLTIGLSALGVGFHSRSVWAGLSCFALLTFAFCWKL